MLRIRFHANPEDYRPIKWPAVGPYWCSGSGDNYNIVIAYVRTIEELLEYWPEATEIDPEERDVILFTDRFARPEWWPEGKLTID